LQSNKLPLQNVNSKLHDNVGYIRVRQLIPVDVKLVTQLANSVNINQVHATAQGI